MPEQRTLLLTGGAGFIGSHTCLELLEHDYQVVVVDDFSNSVPAAVERVEKLAGRQVPLYRVDLRDRRELAEVFAAHRVDAVIHFAAKKAVGESVRRPLHYYDVNVCGTVTLLDVMCRYGVRELVFSSSCSVYGRPCRIPIMETDAGTPVSPYGRSKWMCELVLADACARYSDLSVIALRYFNPVGAHDSGLLGEDPLGVPNNLLPYLAQVAVGRRHHLNVFGHDYPTRDGTCIRDYVHVADVAEGHRLAAEHLGDRTGLRVYNLGTGTGTSVLELIAAFAAACGRDLPYRFAGRRPGDVAELVTDAGRAARDWNWHARRDLATMCQDSWRFQQLNPAGYDR
ncbi:UDP-glucose 4-epimerase GalE [Couchioplanes azureus]|uniref:UDP-glucose 4-epimerase GalE n=1 Tax=Couchioplanes caeruleus TaxID=56438 RepID=UPI0016716B18|nr:UDP-glucose 4-epimerase GalE [Couchioplanes caeruleus]GGQ75481.1 UDP-glucose 4-epimerase [Couchioplanes caeruleus subsp. azureus]